MSDKWFDTFDNVLGLALWLDFSEISAFQDSRDVIYFFEKPWKWDREYHIWQLWNKADTDEQREFIVEGEMNEDTAAAIQEAWDIKQAASQPKNKEIA